MRATNREWLNKRLIEAQKALQAIDPGAAWVVICGRPTTGPDAADDTGGNIASASNLENDQEADVLRWLAKNPKGAPLDGIPTETIQ